MIHEELGHRIQEKRIERGISREYLANNAGISAKFLYEIENGKKGLSAETLLKISNILNCSCDYLLTGTTASSQNTILFEPINHFDAKHTQKLIKIINLIYEISVNE